MLPELNQALIERYAKQLPRYTSYPAAVEFSTKFDKDAWMSALQKDLASYSGEPISIYCHLPFCRSLCYFCACNKIIAKDSRDVDPYLAALMQEIAIYRSCFADSPPIAQIHWGGGSPNFLTPIEMKALFDAIKRAFPEIKPNADISVELDPRTTTREQLQVLRELGFNRISFGVQDFDPEVQRTINRIQSFECTALLCEEARKLGFLGINIDLIYGLPSQTPESYDRTIDLVCSLRPDRIALYGYAHVTWIKKTQKVFERAHLPSPLERIQLFSSAIKRLCSDGYEYIGMDHFALAEDSLVKAKADGTLHRNFMGYTTHKTPILLGCGLSAISMVPGAFAQNYRGLEEYLKCIEKGALPTERGFALSKEDRWRGALIQEIMCKGEVDFSHFQKHWGEDLPVRCSKELDALTPLVDDGLLTVSPSGLKTTSCGRFFLRNIASAFDPYIRERDAKRTFSQSI